jgi:hypothetical protein
LTVLLDRVLPHATRRQTTPLGGLLYDLDRAWPDFTDPLARCFTDLSEWIRSHEGVSGQPFLLGPNGRPDHRVNAFFGSPRMRGLAHGTWKKYPSGVV